MSEYMERAGEFVAEHARYCNTRIQRAEPYVVRYPLAASRATFAATVDDLIRKVARKMRENATNTSPAT